MEKQRKFIWVFLLTVFLMLAGCGSPRETDALESEVWETMPRLTYGVLESEKLTVGEWHSGRAEATSFNTVAETADGYYCTYFTRLYYSDKIQPELWVPVCNKPDCTHVNLTTCNACVMTGTFLIHDGRIYFEEWAGKNPHLYSKMESDLILVSTQKDGTDKQFAYAIEDPRLNNSYEGSGYTDLSPSMWLYKKSAFLPDGCVVTRVYKVDEKGQQLLFEQEVEEERSSTGFLGTLLGDRYYIISEIYPDKLLRFEEEKLLTLDLSSIPENGGYISGKTIRYFVENDGYYDMDIETGNVVRLADAHADNSTAVIMLPNCIVESTILNEEYNSNVKTHTMAIFDGACWKDVEIPQELQNAADAPLLTLRAVTSDSIIFYHTENVTIVVDDITYNYLDLVLYRVKLDQEEWKLEYYATLQQPRETTED